MRETKNLLYDSFFNVEKITTRISYEERSNYLDVPRTTNSKPTGLEFIVSPR